jgi:hypothetical protein
MSLHLSRWLPFFLRLCALLLGAAVSTRAHSHIDVQPVGGQLALLGPSTETMVYVPAGEPFSSYAPRFPGGYYACELTFSSEDPDGATPRIELLSVTGPANGSFAFWEVNATAPTWSRLTGWSATTTDRPSLVTYEDGSGYGHIHGRLFTATSPGVYTILVRAIDDSGTRNPSAPRALTITVHAPPQLGIQVASSIATLTFTSRLNLTYDLQVSTDLTTWTNVADHRFIPGTGATIELTDPLLDRPRVFYRLVEYF